MSSPLHPLAVHLPLALAVLLPLIAAGFALALWKGWLGGRAWIAVVALQGLLFVSSFVALETGEQDEERVEQVVAEAAIEDHEHAAKRFLLGTGVSLGLGIAALLLIRRKEWITPATVVTALSTLVVAGLGVAVGKAGGELVYQHGAASAWAQPGASGPAAQALGGDGEEDHDD